MTLPAFFSPSSDEADCPSGMVEAAILVMLMEEVFDARMVSLESSAARLEKMACLSGRDSDTAWGGFVVRASNARLDVQTDLHNHVYVSHTSQSLFWRDDGDPVPRFLSLLALYLSLCSPGTFSGPSAALARMLTYFRYVLGQKFIHERKAFLYLRRRAVMQKYRDFSSQSRHISNAEACERPFVSYSSHSRDSHISPIWPAPITPTVRMAFATDMVARDVCKK